MKKHTLLLIILLSGFSVFCQEKMYVFLSDKTTLGAPVSAIDSIYFSEDQSIVFFQVGEMLVNYPIAEIDSITFGEESNNVLINYNESGVTLFNPLAFEGVTVTVDGANITVEAAGGIQDINYTLSGNSTDGSFKIYSDKRFYLTLQGLTLTNPDGPAINNQSDKNMYVVLADGTSNVLTDGLNYAEPPNGEDQDGTFFSESDLFFSGNGSLHITCSGNGATYTNTSGQADAYVSTCLTTNGNITINGGTAVTSSSGSAGKAISTNGLLTIGAGDDVPEIQLTTTGTRILVSGSGPNANYAEAKAVKSDDDILINKGNITISSSDDGIKSTTSITINDATVNITGSEEGLEAPYITINGGNVHVKADDDGINTTFGNGGEQNDGSLMTINGGWTVVNTTGGDGLDANGNILITGGTVIVHGPPNAPEVGMDYNGTCNVNGGFLVVSAPNASNMIQAPSSSSALYSLKIKSNQSLSSSTLFHIQDASANDVLTFQPARTYYYIIFSSAALLNGATYDIYTGGTCSGTNTDGLYSGGVYSGGTFRKTFTITGKVTSVTF